MRSVSGCLTCRRRKLKCDERKPICGQCRKAKRECRARDIVFRHSHMRVPPDHGHSQPSVRGNARRRQPDTDDATSGEIQHTALPHSPAPNTSTTRWLEQDSTFTTEDSPLQVTNEVTIPVDLLGASNSSPFRRTPTPHSFLDSILNPSEALEQPSQQAPWETSDSTESAPQIQQLAARQMNDPTNGASLSASSTPESQALVAFLLRHFSEGPGKWMDLYDAGAYFSVDVPIEALTSPLLMAAACAYAAKHVSRIQSQDHPNPDASKPFTATMPSGDNIDWATMGAQYYSEAINLLREELNDTDELATPSDAGSRDRIPRNRSDELLGVTAILCAYEHLTASDLAWSDHLSGTMALLKLATHELRPYALSPGSSDERGISKARKAIFWNFARQDYLAAFINRSQTRIDTEDYRIWRDAGLPLDNAGNLDFHDLTTNHCCTNDSTLRDFVISKSMIWLLAKVNNFISANRAFVKSWQSDRPPDAAQDYCKSAGKTQLEVLKNRWTTLSSQLDVWIESVPSTFKPCARIPTPHHPFPEIWFSREMCASTYQSYHLARILLLLHNPYSPTAEVSTITRLLRFYRTTETELTQHCYEILGVMVSHKSTSMYVHQCQTLYVIGQCLSNPDHRALVVDYLRKMRAETGWETEYRVQHLFAEWENEPKKDVAANGLGDSPGR